MNAPKISKEITSRYSKLGRQYKVLSKIKPSSYFLKYVELALDFNKIYKIKKSIFMDYVCATEFCLKSLEMHSLVKSGDKVGASTILGGDLLISFALQILYKYNSPEIIKYFSASLADSCKGNIEMLLPAKNSKRTVNEKSCALFSTALMFPVLVSDGDVSLIKRYSKIISSLYAVLYSFVNEKTKKSYLLKSHKKFLKISSTSKNEIEKKIASVIEHHYIELLNV